MEEVRGDSFGSVLKVMTQFPHGMVVKCEGKEGVRMTLRVGTHVWGRHRFLWAVAPEH